MTTDALSPYPDTPARASRGHRVAQLLHQLHIGELWHDESVTPARVANFRDKAIRLLLLEQWVLLAPIAITAWCTGNSWIGLLVVGGLFHACTSFFRKVDPIGLTTRSMIATGLLLDVLLLIYALTGTGSWQMDGGHMWVFAVWAHALGLLCWRSLVVSGTLGILHHFVLVFVFPLWVFPDGANLWRVVLHAGIVLIEGGVLIWLTAYLAKLLADNDRALSAMSEGQRREQEHAAERLEIEERSRSERRRAHRAAIASRSCCTSCTSASCGTTSP